ncbi:hypothetical protein [Nocardiopsis sp. NPDC057823]|uniref:hypothetical protein n=1 Tax=Nocardiopsis sp. NPDC057823 TaxID=3346256 RepID=UPI00366AC0E4
MLWMAQFGCAMALIGSGQLRWALIFAVLSLAALWTWDFAVARKNRHEKPPHAEFTLPSLRDMLWMAQFAWVMMLIGSGQLRSALIFAVLSLAALWTWDFAVARKNRHAPSSEPEEKPAP